MRPQGAVAATRALGEYARLERAATYAEAVARLGDREVDLVIAGIYFDEIRLFDLLRYVRQERPGVPVLCARLGETEVPAITLEGISIAATAMGAAAFLDMPILRGEPALDQEFRSAVLRHVRRR
jgi:DNA-binding NtrC family response regulator